MIEVAIEPRRRADQAKLAAALLQIGAEDDGFRFSVDHESGQIIMSSTSEFHLGIIAGRLWREFEVEANIGATQPAYRETISRIAEVDYTFKKQTGGSGEYAPVKLRLEPLRGSEMAFENAAAGGVPEQYVPSLEQSVREALQQGALAGFPVIGIKVSLTDGTYHEVDSSVSAFEAAARAAVKEGLAKVEPKLLEPIVRVDVVTPENYVGDVVADLNDRCGGIIGRGQRGNAEVVSAMVPLANLFDYAEDLVRMSSGEATVTMRSVATSRCRSRPAIRRFGLRSGCGRERPGRSPTHAISLPHRLFVNLSPRVTVGAERVETPPQPTLSPTSGGEGEEMGIATGAGIHHTRLAAAPSPGSLDP